jgi:hypothetical protein
MPDSGLGKGEDSRTQIRNVNMNRLVHANRQLKFNKRSQLFIGTHNKASGILALCGHDSNCPPSSSVLEMQPQFQPALLSLSAMTMRCASTIQIVRPSESTVEAGPKERLLRVVRAIKSFYAVGTIV